MRLLYIDDHPSHRHIMQRVATLAEHTLTLAANGQEGLLLADQSFDMVLVDISLPDIDGLTLVKMLREAFPAAPIIAVTAYGAKDLRQQCLAAGYAEYVSKPFRLQDMIDLLNRLQTK